MSSIDERYKEWKQKKKQSSTGVGATASTTQNVTTDDRYKAWRAQRVDLDSVAKSIYDRANTWLENHNNYLANYNERYSGRTGTFDDKYVADAEEWTATVYQQRYNFEREANNIVSMLDRYSDYLDADWVNTLKSTLESAQKQQVQVSNYVRDDGKYWSQFADENEYGQYQAYYQQQKRLEGYQNKYAGKSYDEIQAAIGMLDDGEEKQWLSQYQFDLLRGNEDFSDKAASGWDRYQTEQEAKNQAQKEETFWDKLGRWLGPAGAVDTSISLGNAAEITHNLAADTSYQRPKDSWSEEQKAMYGYLYETDRGAAAKYAHITNEANNQAENAEKIAAIENWATKNGWNGAAATIGAIAMMPLSLADTLSALTEYNAKGFVSTPSTPMPGQVSQAITSAISSTLNEKYGTLNDDLNVIGGKGWGDAYQLATSIAQSMISAYTQGSVGTTMVFFGSASSSGMYDAKNRGATDKQAITFGILTGLAEAAGEAFSVEKLLALKGVDELSSFFGNVLLQAGIEASEEGVTTLLNNFSDQLVMGDKSNFNILVKQYMSDGLSEDEAKKKAWKSMANDLAFDMLGGAISGGVSSGIQMGVQTAAGNHQAKEIYGSDAGALVGEALEIDPGNAYAQKMQQKLDAGKSLSGGQLNKLVQQNEKTMTAQDMQAIQSAAAQRLTELGVTENVDAIAQALAKQAAGEQLTSQEKRLAKEYDVVAQEMNPQNIREGKYSAEWAQKIGTNKINAQEYGRMLQAADRAQEGAETTGGQVAAEVQNEAQRGQLAAVEEAEAPAATVRENRTVAENATVSEKETVPANDRQMTGKLTCKEGLQVAEDGVTRQVSSGKEVTPKKIASIEGGKVMIETDNGTVAADDIEFGDTDTDMLWRSATRFSGITTAGANGVIHAYKGNMPVASYLHGAAQEFKNGYYNLPSGGEAASKLTDAQRAIIYELGQKAAGENTAKAQAAKKAATRKDGTRTVEDAGPYTQSGGKVHFDRKGRTFDAKRETALKTMEQMSKALGVEFYVYESYRNGDGKLVYKDANGNERPAPNGFYDPTDGSIHIDLNAGTDGKGTMLFTIAHELTHFIRDWSPAKFKVLANFLVEQYGEKGVSVEELVHGQIKKAKDHGRTIDYDTAFEEVVADSMEAMLTDGNVVQVMADLKQQDKSLWQKICEWFKDLANDLKALVDAYKGVKPDSAEGKMVAQMQDVIVMLEALYEAALADASENFQAAKAEKNTTREGGEAKYQLREYSEHQRENWKGSKRIVVYENTQHLQKFIQESLSDKSFDKKMYFGAVQADLANLIQQNTGLDVDGYNVSLGSNEIRKIMKDHGDESREVPRGQRAVTVEDIANIPNVIQAPVSVALSPNQYNGKPAIVFSGNSNGRMTVVAVVSDKRLDLFVQTAYVSAKKRNLATPTGEQAPINTPEANSGTVSTTNIAQEKDNVKEKFSDRDSDGNELSKEQQEYFKDSKVRDEQGRLLAMYHGTPSGGFTKFRSGTYFTQNPGYADVYQNPGASSISPKKGAEAPMTYKVYLDIKKPFDTRNARERRIFQQEFYLKYGTGTPLADSGLPDWVDGMDLQEFIEEMEYDYDGLILDEGGTGGYGDEVKSRGLSYVVFNPAQVKNVDNKTPTNDPDIRYSEREGDENQNADIYSRVFDMQAEVGELQRSIEAFEKSAEFKAANDKLSEAIRNDNIAEGVQEYRQWRESSGYAALIGKRDALRVALENLIQERDKLTANDSAKAEQDAIAKSGLSEADYFRKQAVKEFGYTPYFYDAGYMTPNGKMLNFSGEKGKHFGSRGEDHRAIGIIYEDTQGSAAMVRFMNDGNIRIMAETPGLDISSSAEPTKEQYAQIKKFAREYGSKERYFAVDISDENGRVVGNYEYDGYVNADRVVNDIKYYFENGIIREQSSVASFLHSERDPELEKVNRVLEKENTQLKHDVAYLKELLKLQNQATGGTKFTKSSVEAAAGQLQKYADAKGDRKELAGLLNAVYEYIAKGEELTWEGVKEAAQPAVDWLQSHVRTRTERSAYAQDVLKEIRNSKVYLDETQKKEVAYQYGSYNEFRKRCMGSVILTDSATMSLDSQWHEWAGQYPNLFDMDISSTDMPAALMEVFDSLRNMTETDSYGYDQELFGQELLSRVYDSYWNVSTLYTVKDKAQKEINKLKFDHAGRMATLKKYHKEQTEKLRQEHREALQKVKREQQERFDKKLQETKERYQESREKNAENRRKTEMRRKIRRTIMDLKKILNKGDKKRNVKEDMKDLVAEALRSADILFTDNYGNEDMVRYGVGTELTEQEAKYMRDAQDILAQIEGAGTAQERLEMENMLSGKLEYRMGKLKDVFLREKARLNKATVSEVLGSLADAYKSLENSDQTAVNGAFDENVYQYLATLKEEVGGTIVKDMCLYQLEELHRAYTMVLTTVRNANKMFAANLQKTREQLGSQVIGEVKRAGGEHGLWRPGEDKLNAFSWNNQKPVYAFERIGSETLTQLFENTRAGEDSWALDMAEARKYYLEQTRKFKYDSWDFGKQYKFTSTSGIDFTLNLEQIMSLYAYSKREQAHDHLLKGGFVFDSNTEVQVNKMGIKVTYLNKTAKAHNVSFEILAEIVSKLTPEQKGFVDQMQDYLSTTMGEKGNEVSMQLYGVKMFNEKHYFPLRSAGQYMARAKEADLKKQQGQISIVNSGFTKATTPKSSNPVVLSGFMDVWADHVNEMSMYHSFVLPMEDFRRVYNYASPNMETGQSISVNSVIQDAYGEAATNYIDQLYRDLNGGAVSDPRETPAKVLMGKFKKAAVFASLSVVIQQPSAVGRAFAIIDPKYFIGSKVDSKRHKALWAELKQYAPVAAIKEMGYFDTGMGKSAQDFIRAKEYNSLKEKAAALFTDENYRDEVLSKAPALADELTWCTIWEAAKRETRAKNPKMDVKSEEFLQLAGKRFTEVVTKTQVYDSVLSRSANMRSKGAFMNMWTAFMAEPTTTINMVEDALRKGKQGDKKYAARAMGAVLSSIIINSLLVSLVQAMRDDDEDETFLEKYVQSFATEILEGINPITYYPFLKDIWSALQGYDIERSDMSLISSLTEKITKLVQVYAKDAESRNEGELADAWWGVVDYVTALTGVPVKNVRRDINGAVSSFKTIAEDLTDRDTTWGSLLDKTWDDVKNSLPVVGWMRDETAADKLYKATVSGDTAYQKRLESAYETQTALDNAIRKGLRANDSRIWEAAMAWNNNDLEGYKRIAKEIVAEGNFSQDNIVMAIQAEAKAMIETPASDSASKAKGYFTAEKFAVAISQGNDTMAATIKADIVDTAMVNGKTAEEAEDSFKSSAKSSMKELFQEGGITEDQAVQALVDYFGISEEDAAEDVQYWAFQVEYPDYDLSEGAVTDYYEYAEPAGIGAAVYYEYYTKASPLESDKDEDGKPIRNSLKKKIMAVIDAMDLTKAQKDALYYANGWAKSEIYEAPWH